jgi:methylated-DNA-[protein]-cysteine S-methyltransferase
MKRIYFQYYKSPCGEMLLGDCDEKLCIADWQYRKARKSVDNRLQKTLAADFEEKNTPVLVAAKQQLDEYFEGKRMDFDLPLLLVGTSFQQKVWQSLLKIPYGETATYLQLSRILGDEKAIRAVANANGANALSIIVPCHRIIGSNNDLTGYAGGLDAKKFLLTLENKDFAKNPTAQMMLFTS